MGDFSEHPDYDAVGLAELVRSRQVAPIDLVDAAIARIEAAEPALNAVIDRLYDEARQRATGPATNAPLGVQRRVRGRGGGGQFAGTYMR